MNAARTHRRARRSTSGPVDYPVLVIDDHELFSTTLAMALRSEGFDAQTVPVRSVQSFVSGDAPRTAGLAVLDLDLGQDTDGSRLNGADLVEGLRSRGWKVLVVSGGVDRAGVAAALAGGARRSLPKSRPFEDLLETVIMAANGSPVMTGAERQVWLERHRRHTAQQRDLARRLARLSVREHQVLELLADGMRAAAIAKRSVVSVSTVRSQIRSILAKLEVGSQLEAVAAFRRHERIDHRSGHPA